MTIDHTPVTSSAIFAEYLCNHDDPKSFEKALAEASKEDRLEALRIIATDPMLGTSYEFKAKGFFDRAEQLFAQVKQDDGARGKIHEIIIAAAGGGEWEVFDFLVNQSKDKSILDNALLMAIRYEANEPDEHKRGENAVQNIKTLLSLSDYTPSQEVIYQALKSAEEKYKGDQFKELAAYAGEKYPDLLNRKQSDDTTFFERILQMDESHIQARDKMIWALLQGGATPPVSIGKVDIGAFLEHGHFPEMLRDAIHLSFKDHGMHMPEPPQKLPERSAVKRVVSRRTMTATDISELPRFP